MAPHETSRASAPAAGLPPVAVILAALMAAVLVATAWSYGPFGDEFYYIECGRHLAAGYVDHPPLVALVAFVVGKVFGPSYVALRVVAALAGAVAVLLAARLAARLGGGRFAQSLAALAMVAAPGFWSMFGFYSMNPLHIVIVSLLLLLLIDLLEGGGKWRWIAFGVLAGVGLLNKLTLLPIGGAMLVGLACTRQRRVLASPWPWVAAGIAALILVPHVLWQVANGWPTLDFIRQTKALYVSRLSPGAYLLQVVIMLNPALAPLWIGGLVWLLSGRPRESGRVLGVMSLAVVALFTAQTSKVYYVFPVMPLLLAAGAVGVERFAARTAARWIRPAAATVVAVTGLALLPLGAPVLPLERALPYWQATRLLPHLKMTPYDRPDVPVLFALRFGWREMVAQVALAFQSLSPAERAGCVIVTNNFSKAGAVNYYRAEYGLPEAYSGHNSCRYWVPAELPLKAAVTVGVDEGLLRRSFRDVRLFGVHRHPHAAQWETDQKIFVSREPTRPWSELRRELSWD